MTREEIESVENGVCPNCKSRNGGIQEIADIESHFIEGVHSEEYGIMCDCGFHCAKIRKWRDGEPEWIEWA